MEIKYSKAQALKIIKRILKNGSYGSTKHFRKRMKERHIDIHDILHVINNGNIYNEPEIHLRTGRWTYTVEGKIIDDHEIKIAVDIHEENNRISLLTVMI